MTAALAPTNFVTLPVGRTEIYSKKLHLFITETNLTEFVSFILTKCGINVKRKVVLLLDLLF